MKKILALLFLVPALAFAWEPTKPITVSVGNPPGAGNEVAFRELSAVVMKNNPKLKFVIENRPGADSVVNMNLLLTQPNDGYYAAIPSHMSTYVTNDIWETKVKKFEYNSFTQIMTIGKSPLALVAVSRSEVNTPIDFIKLIATTQKPVNVAIGGGAHRMAFEYLMLKGNGKKDMVKPIKYQGPLQAVTAVASDSGMEFGIMPIAIAQPLIQAGKVKAIGLTGTRKMPNYPDVPLLNSVAPGINVYGAWTLTLPPNAPKDVQDWYIKTFTKAIKSKEYQEWCKANNVFVPEDELTPAGVNKHIEELRANFMPLAKSISQESN